MNNEESCPYCGYTVDICHDDGYGYEEDETYEQECSHCGKTFVYTTSIQYYHYLEQAPCKNGAEHEWEQIVGCPKEAFIGEFRCKYCGERESREPEKRRKALVKSIWGENNET